MNVVTVIAIQSLSYTGSTWLNMVLGSHERTFALGPPDRLWRLAQEGNEAEACRVHAEKCRFWREFADRSERSGNLLVDVARHSGKDVIVLNNPTPQVADEILKDERLAVRQINLVRDGRAVLASYLRSNPGKNFLQGLTEWLQPALESFYFDESDSEILCLRYEDVLARPYDHLERIGGHAGVLYEEAALEYWTHDHHPVAGNSGTLSLIRFEQGLFEPKSDRLRYYRDQLDRLREQGPSAFEAQSWEAVLSRHNRLLYDLVCGDQAERFGYPRDAFTVSEMLDVADLLESAAQGDEQADALIAPLRSFAQSLLSPADARERRGSVAVEESEHSAERLPTRVLNAALRRLPGVGGVRRRRAFAAFAAAGLVATFAAGVLAGVVIWGG